MTMRDRVYDRITPLREGWLVSYDQATHTGKVEWDDGEAEENRDVDALGTVPPRNKNLDELCDECGQSIPYMVGGGLANRYHAESCSLYDADEK
jgi:hypothetical protein